MAFYHNLVKWFITRRLERLKQLQEKPFEAQEVVLQQILQDGLDCRFARDNKLFNATQASFEQCIPLQQYSDLEPYIKRIREGRQGELTTLDVNWFAKSSGTTSHRSKFIPLTKKALEDCHFAGGKDIMALYLNAYPDSRLVEGKSLVLGGSQQPESLGTSLFIGDLSAVLIENLPMWAQWVRTPDRETALLPDWETKLQRMVEKTRSEDVTSIAGVPSWNLVFLQRLLAYTKAETIREVWPNIELFIHGGVSLSSYKEQFDNIMGKPDFRYLETYNASEGFFGLQDDLSSPDLLLLVGHGIYYEFIEQGDWADENPPCCSLQDVEVGKTYEMVITTNGGLWRYRIGDTIRFTSTDPHRFRLVGRTKYYINMSGEEVVVDNVKQALAEACKRTGAVVTEYTGGPRFSTPTSKGCHEYVMAFSKRPDSLSNFTYHFDKELSKANSDYEAKRTDGLVLTLPKIHAVDEDLFYRWMKQRGKLGGQNKVPRLANNRKHLEELLALTAAY